MKQLIFSLLFAIIAATSIAQTTGTFKYQAIARDSTGNVYADKPINLKISIIQGSMAGVAIYSEGHHIRSNNQGLIHIEIGKGTPITGKFETIDWGKNLHFIKTELDINESGSYINMGTSQILSVPYANYAQVAGVAKTAENVKWQSNSNDVYYELGNIGIGTKLPSANLHINTNETASLKVESKNSQSVIQMISSQNYNPSLNFGVDGVAGSKGGIYFDNLYNQIVLRANPEKTTDNELSLSSNGFLGVGKKTPQHRLDVNGNLNVSGNILKNNIPLENFWTKNNNNISFSSGNVGIGTANPNSKIDINGDINFTGNLLKNGQLYNPETYWTKNGTNISFTTGKIGIGTEQPSSDLHIVNKSDNAATLKIESTNSQSVIQMVTSQLYNPSINFGVDGIAGSKGGIYFDNLLNQIVLRANPNKTINNELSLSSNGFLGIGNKSPQYRLDVNGDINLTGNILKNNIPIENVWTKTNNNISYSSGNVGIGTENPGYKVDINGDINFTGNLLKNGQIFNSETYWTKNGNNISFQTGKIGIGIQQPLSDLHLKNAIDNAIVRIESSSSQAGIQLITEGTNNPFISFGTNGEPGSKGGIYYDNIVNQFIIRADKVFSQDKEFIFNNNGNLGLGVKNPKAKIEIQNGDIYINNPNNGIILKSSDGSCWRVTINNSGEFVKTKIDCP